MALHEVASVVWCDVEPLEDCQGCPRDIPATSCRTAPSITSHSRVLQHRIVSVSGRGKGGNGFGGGGAEHRREVLRDNIQEIALSFSVFSFYLAFSLPRFSFILSFSPPNFWRNACLVMVGALLL